MGDGRTRSNDDSEGPADRPLIVGARASEPPTDTIQRLEREVSRFPGRIPDPLRKAWRGFRLVMFIAPFLVCLGVLLPVALPSILCLIGLGESCPLQTAPVLGEGELHEAEARLEEIFQQRDMEACTEFKGKRYAEHFSGGTATTDLFYACVLNLSIAFKDEQRCLALSDDYARRICLQALAMVYQDANYCKQADAFARDEVARESYPQAASETCYQYVGACEYIEDVSIREGCQLTWALHAGDLDPTLCRSLTDARIRDQCFENVAVFKNLPELCLETSDADYCYYSGVVITARNLGMEDEIDRKSWCEKIGDETRKLSCRKDIQR